ncbi:MAG: penicillin-binding protein 2 [Candidatus Latescibacterota bacterium]
MNGAIRLTSAAGAAGQLHRPAAVVRRPGDVVASRVRRLGLLALGGGLAWLVIVLRLVWVQAVRHEEYLIRARDQHERRLEVKGHRGRLLDRRGRVMAVDVRAYTYYADPTEVDQPTEVARYFTSLGTQTAANLERQLRGGGRFVYLARQLDGDALAQAEQVRFKGVYRRPETKRYYPQGGVAGQIVGYTNVDNQGSEGIELAFEELLRPTSGSAMYQVTALGAQVPGSRQERQSPEDGKSVLLTLDAAYQDILEQELAKAVEGVDAESGMAIVTDPRTGEILALANVPLYDPNEPGEVAARFRRNRIITDPYEPGSTFKVITASSVLEEKLAAPGDMMFCENGRMSLGHGQVLRDHDPYGTLSFTEVIEKSSNIGTLKFARRLSRARYYEYMRKFGFAARTSLGLPAESAGLLKPVSRWSDRSLETIAIGQEISVTGLQLAMAVGAVANGGNLVVPQLVKGFLRPDGSIEETPKPDVVRRVLSPETAAQMRRILTGVVEKGTGKKAQIPGVAVAGKTGTAQRALPNGGGYASGETVVSFIGFLPAEAPELLCLVVIENPQREKWGGTLAAPIFQRVMERILYLPDDDRRIAVQRPAVEPEEVEEAPVAIPELRGLTRQVASFQAGLRGIPVAFTGGGEVVVEQVPAPGDTIAEVLRISCVLGTPTATAVAAADSLVPYARQAHLLRLLGEAPPAASGGM